MILCGLVMCLFACTNLEKSIKGTWYVIDTNRTTTLDIYDETAVFHNRGLWDDCYIEWKLDEENLVLNANGHMLYYQVLDDPDYGQVLYDPDKGEIYACHDPEDANRLIAELIEKEEKERAENEAILKERADKVKGLFVGTWIRDSFWSETEYIFKEDGTYQMNDYSDREEGPVKTEKGTYEIAGNDYEGVGDPYKEALYINLSEVSKGSVIYIERLEKGVWLYNDREYIKQ